MPSKLSFFFSLLLKHLINRKQTFIREIGQEACVRSSIKTQQTDNLIRTKVHSKHVFTVGTSKPPPQPMIFTPEDEKRVSYPYDDAMVIVTDVNGFIIKRILVNSKSSYTVLI